VDRPTLYFCIFFPPNSRSRVFFPDLTFPLMGCSSNNLFSPFRGVSSPASCYNFPTSLFLTFFFPYLYTSIVLWVRLLLLSPNVCFSPKLRTLIGLLSDLFFPSKRFSRGCRTFRSGVLLICCTVSVSMDIHHFQ